MTTVVGPLTPSDEELGHMTKPQLTAVIESYGVRPSSKTDKPGLLKTARAFVHELRSAEHAAVAEAAEPAAPVETAPETPSTDVVPLDDAPLHVIPEYSRFQVIQQIAAVLVKSNLTPDSLRGHLPDVTHILLKANDVGIPLTTAIEQVYVIKGKTGMESKLMRALIRRDGHTLSRGTCDGYRAVVSGRRADTGEEGEAEFTLDDAIEFELIEGYDITDDGRYVVRPVMVSGNNGRWEPKPQWRKDTKTMLTERATARLARWLFSECLGGITYTPDELGYIEVEGEEVEKPRYGRAGEAEPTMTHRQMVASLAERIADLPDDVRRELAQKWSAANFPRVDDLRPPQVPTATRWVEEAEAKTADRDSTDEIPEAEEVPDHDGGQPDPARSGDDGVEGSNATDRDAEPSPAEDRQEAGEPGSSDGQPGDGGPAESPAAASPAPAEPPLTVEDVGPLCAGCHEEISGAAVETDDGPYHPDCAPYGEPGETLL